MTTTHEKINNWLAGEIESCEHTVAQFAQRLADKDQWDAAAYAFEWGEQAAIAAGKLRTFKHMQAGVKGIEVAEAIHYATLQVIQGARNPQHSTSQLSNLVKESEIAGFAEFVQKFSV